MTFSLDVPAKAGLDQLRATLDDPARVIACIPGVERCVPGADGYELEAVVGLGPVRLRLRGSARLEPAPGGDGLTASVSLHEAVSGSIYGTFALALGEGSVAVRAEVVAGGRLGEFAAPLLRRKAEDAVRGFAANLAELAAG